jgi:hypothetical protein
VPHSVLSFGAKERTKENIHPSPSLPYMGELKFVFAELQTLIPFGIAGRRDVFFDDMPLTIDASFINAQPYKKILANPEGAQA